MLDSNRSVVVFNLSLSNSTFTQNPILGVLPKYTLTEPVFPFTKGRALVPKPGSLIRFQPPFCPAAGHPDPEVTPPCSHSDSVLIKNWKNSRYPANSTDCATIVPKPGYCATLCQLPASLRVARSGGTLPVGLFQWHKRL